MSIGPYISEEINWYKYDSFIDYEDFVPSEYKQFLRNWKKLHKDNRTVKKGDIIYGIRKGSKIAQWKYDYDEYKLYHSIEHKELFDIYHGRL